MSSTQESALLKVTIQNIVLGLIVIILIISSINTIVTPYSFTENLGLNAVHVKRAIWNVAIVFIEDHERFTSLGIIVIPLLLILILVMLTFGISTFGLLIQQVLSRYNLKITNLTLFGVFLIISLVTASKYEVSQEKEKEMRYTLEIEKRAGEDRLFYQSLR